MRVEVIGNCTLYNSRMEDVVPNLPQHDLALIDPPYGINADSAANKAAMARINADGKNKSGKGWGFYEDKGWDSERPPQSSFDLIRSTSTEQIIWGGNYFTDYLPPSMRWLVWDKGQRDFSLADCEFAWSSQNKASRIFNYARGKALQDGKRHPTQKPVALMEWCLGLVPKSKTVLDSYMGSGTCGVACVKLGRSFTGIELDPDYFDIAVSRITKAYEQRDLFIPDAPKAPTPIQEGFDL